MEEQFKYERKYHYEALGANVVRAPGSGAFDLVLLWPDRGLVEFLQLKVVTGPKVAKRLINNFRGNPPFNPMQFIHQRLEVKVKGSKEVLSVTI